MSDESNKFKLVVARLATVLALIIALPALGCGSTDEPGGGGYVADATDSLPGETVQDWTTFSDHLAVVTPVADRQTEPEFVEPGQYLAGRELTLKIDRVLWTRTEAPSLPQRISFAQGGWMIVDGDRRNFDTGGSPRMEIGHTYLVPLVLFPGEEWGPLSSASVYSYDSNQIGNGTKVIGVRDSSWLDQFEGQDAARAVKKLSSTPPYPGAESFMDLEPEQRYQALLKSEK